MVNLDYKELQRVFNQWSQEYSLIPVSEWISFDGKSLKNTVSDYDNAKQYFINCVSARTSHVSEVSSETVSSFSHQRKLVLGVKMMENKHESEINVVRELIELLDLTDVVFSFDALHCQKKPYQRSRARSASRRASSGNDYLVKVKINLP